MSEKWFDQYFDDSKWAILDAGRRWEDQGYPELDEYAWYRKVVHISSDWKGKSVSDQVISSHSNSPTIVDWDKNEIPDLLVGEEDGHFYYLKNPKNEK